MKKESKNLKSQIGMFLIVALILAAAVYGFFNSSEQKDSTPAVTQESSQAASCGLTPSATPGCSVPVKTTSSEEVKSSDDTAVVPSTDAQTINMTYDESGLSPAAVTVEKGKSYTIVIKVNVDVFGCMGTIKLPGLDDTLKEVKKGTTISFHIQPTTIGNYEFQCAMGLSHNAKVVVK